MADYPNRKRHTDRQGHQAGEWTMPSQDSSTDYVPQRPLSDIPDSGRGGRAPGTSTGVRSSRTDIVIKIKLGSPDIPRLIKKLESVVDDTAGLKMVMRRAVAASFLIKLRTRFLQKLRHALEMHVIYENGKEVQKPLERMNKLSKRARLENLYAALSEAEMSGNRARADKIRSESIPKAREALINMLGKTRDGTTKPAHWLTELNGVTTMRRLALGLLDDMTSINNVGLMENQYGMTVGIGDVAALEQVETPSATPMLIGKATTSRYKILMRHLEFGTGVFRKEQRNEGVRGKVGNPGPYGPGKFGKVEKSKGGMSIIQGAPQKAWFYGRNIANGLLLKGTYPMNFLTDGSGKPYEEDWTAFQMKFNAEMEQLLSL